MLHSAGGVEVHEAEDGGPVEVVVDGDGHALVVEGAPTTWRWRAGDGAGRRAAAVAAVESGRAGVAEVAEAVGVDRVTLWRWRRQQHRREGTEPHLPRRPARRRPDAPEVAGWRPTIAPPVAGDVPHNLPTAATTFVGRDEEVVWVARLLGASRLATVTGTAGVGKTRLALRTAALLARGHPDGVWWAALASVEEPEGVPAAVAAAAGLRLQPGRSASDSLVTQLASQRALIVLDNCEHLVEACARLVVAIVAGCPGVSVLATSRERLGVPGEEVSFLSPLAVPEPSEAGVEESESVRLFCERARAADAGFALTAETAPAVVRICRRLEGIPLAIELAAARTASLPVAQIAATLDDRLAAPGGPGVDHRTMTGALDWSHHLLDDGERAVLRRLSVFVGGAGPDAAAAVCGHGSVAPAAVAAVVDALVAKSLVVADGDGPGRRWRLLETVRDYGAERLAEAGEGPATMARFARWCTALAEEAEPHLTGPDQPAWIERLDADHENLRRAVEWAAGGGDPAMALRLGGAMALYWRAGGHFAAGRACLDAVLAAGPDAPAPARAKALWGWGFMTLMLGAAADAGPALASALALYQEAGDDVGAARCLLLLGDFPQVLGPERSPEAVYEECVDLARRAGDTWSLGHALAKWAWELDVRCQPGPVLELFEEALAVGRRAGDAQSVRIALVGLGSAVLHQGDLTRAEVLLAEALAVVRSLGEEYETAMTLYWLGRVAIARGDLGRAGELLGEALPLARSCGNPGAVVHVLQGVADVALHAGDVGEAGARYEEAAAIVASVGGALPALLIALGRVALAAGRPADARFRLDAGIETARRVGDLATVADGLAVLGDAARATGDSDHALACYQEALEIWTAARRRPAAVAALEALAALAADAGRATQAARLLGAAQAARDAGGLARSAACQQVWDGAVAAVSRALAPAALEEAWSAGAGLSPEEAAAYALRGRRRSGERPATGWASLTPAEAEVAALVGDALTNAEIAERLFMSLSTVKVHLGRIFGKLGIESRRELARLATRR